ncbi:MAG: methyltransferase domain-containing protein [Candidatus Promineifilaceae bacterium]
MLGDMVEQSFFTDTSYLQRQYGTKDNLQIRIATHEIYSEPKVDFTTWVLDHVPWRGRERVLDVGCGSGIYRQPTQQRAPTYLAGDLSLGMLQSLPPATPRLNLDVQHLPLAANSVDVILANHMLYHVPDQAAAAAHFARVLKPGGYLLAATNSRDNRLEMAHLVAQVATACHIPLPAGFLSDGLLSFTLENGAEVLQPHFAHVERHDLSSAFVFPHPQPVIDYIGTTRERILANAPQGITWEQIAEALYIRLSDHIRQHGVFRVNKVAGVFVCRKE